jgi:hypothetical protein
MLMRKRHGAGIASRQGILLAKVPASPYRTDGRKIDLMPDEVSALRDAAGDQDAIRRTLAEVDSGFAEGLDLGEIDQVSKRLK